MRIAALIAGAIAVLLGGLWTVQGLGLVTIDPILCVADCAPLEGPAPGWAITGILVLAAGLFALYWGTRLRR